MKLRVPLGGTTANKREVRDQGSVRETNWISQDKITIKDFFLISTYYRNNSIHAFCYAVEST